MAFPYYVGDNLFGCNPETEGMLMIFILSICVCKLLNYNFIVWYYWSNPTACAHGLMVTHLPLTILLIMMLLNLV
jgi:hypothetical protein